MTIIARRTRDPGSEYVVIDRGEAADVRYVSAIVTPASLAGSEWWLDGYAFATREGALKHFLDRD